MLLGRQTEQRVVDELLQKARGGHSAVLVLRGEFGIGKTSLLGYAEGNAGDMTVLRCAGVEAEHEFPFAGLHQLLRPCLGLLYRLAAPQQAALRSAFGMSFDPVLSPYLVSLGVLSLLAEACEDAPVLCLIDDAHWLDRPSQEALAFAARRLEAEPVAILMASRQRPGQRFEAAGLPELEFGGLDDRSARALLDSRLKRPAADEIVTMLVRAARGNPLALLELPVSLTDRQLDGTDPIAGPLRAKGAVEESFRTRVGLLSADARRALLLAAADEGGDLHTLESALRQSGLPLTAFHDAEDAGLVQQVHGTVVFRHPLVRSAAYRCATRSERQTAHQALAAVLDDPVRRAWHRALAADRADESIAAELDSAGAQAVLRGANATAAAAFERAAELSQQTSRQAHRLIYAAQTSLAAGFLDASVSLTERARPLVTEQADAAELEVICAAVSSKRGSPANAFTVLSPGSGPADVQGQQVVVSGRRFDVVHGAHCRHRGCRDPPDPQLTPVAAGDRRAEPTRPAGCWQRRDGQRKEDLIDQLPPGSQPVGLIHLRSRESDVHDPHPSSTNAADGTAVQSRCLTRSATGLTVSDRRPASGKPAANAAVARYEHHPQITAEGQGSMSELQHAGGHAPVISTAARPASKADVLTAHRRAGRRFEAAGAGSFVREQGDGPTVVCIHGMIGTSFLYRKVLAELAARGLRGVAFDLPGFGLADRPPGYDYSWTGLGRFCVAAVDELSLDRFHLVVHDIGGPVGFELATAMPTRITSLTLLNTTIDVADFRSPWTMEPFRHRGIGELWMASLTPPAFRFLMRLQGIGDPATVSRAELDTYLALIKGPDHGRAFLQIMRSTERTVAKQARYRAAVRNVPYPVQAIWAADDPAMTLAGYGEKARTAAGLARLHTVPGKHFPQEDQAPAIASQIAEFVLLQQNVDPRVRGGAEGRLGHADHRNAELVAGAGAQAGPSGSRSA